MGIDLEQRVCRFRAYRLLQKAARGTGAALREEFAGGREVLKLPEHMQHLRRRHPIESADLHADGTNLFGRQTANHVRADLVADPEQKHGRLPHAGEIQIRLG